MLRTRQNSGGFTDLKEEIPTLAGVRVWVIWERLFEERRNGGKDMGGDKKRASMCTSETGSFFPYHSTFAYKQGNMENYSSSSSPPTLSSTSCMRLLSWGISTFCLVCLCWKCIMGSGGWQTPRAFVSVQSAPDEKKDHCTTRFIHDEVFHLHIAVTSVAAFKHKGYWRTLPWKRYSAQITLGNSKQNEPQGPGWYCQMPDNL